MDYDILILGGGMLGCAVAYELSKYSLNIALIEKEYDIAGDVSIINSAVVYDGIECEDDLTAKLEKRGNKLFEDISNKFNVPFKRTGSYIVACNEDEEKRLNQIYNRAVRRGYENLALLQSKHLYNIEPHINKNIKEVLYCKNIGVTCPYDMAIAYGEIAFDNGVNFKLEEEVKDIIQINKGYKVITSKNKFTCKIVINTTPRENYTIDSLEHFESNSTQRYLNYFMIQNKDKKLINSMVFSFGDNGEKVYSVPTVSGEVIMAVESKNELSFEETFERSKFLMPSIEEKLINAFYSTLFYKDVIIMDDSLIDRGYVKMRGKHYGEITMTPYLALMVCETIVAKLKCSIKKDFIDKRRDFYRFKNMNNEDRNRIIKLNKDYGKIICTCQKVTEGEIIDSIRRPLGARTLEGIRRRTGVTFGDCNGSYCIDKIVSILARETNKKVSEIVKDSKNSNIVTGRIKEF